MKIESSAFGHNQPIPEKYTCDGEDINPPLEFLDVPANTKSLALIMEDPDVPRSIRPDGIWDHWIIFNILPNTQAIVEGGLIVGTLGTNTGGNLGYGGPCPPDREHRYYFKLFALDSLLGLSEGATKQDLFVVMKNHILEQAELMGTYKRA